MNRTRISDVAIKAKTGRQWQQWFSILDKAGAMKMRHNEIAEYLYEKRGMPSWWCQMVSVTYEQERGLRKVHERIDGYSVSASKTYEVPVIILYKNWNDEKLRKQWLKDKFTIKKATANKSIRIMWPDNTNVDVEFYSKALSKSQVVVQHSKLASSTEIERVRSRWKAALERLSEVL